jgi:hypothetical protein
MSKRVLVLTGTTDILRQPNETDNTMEEVFDLTLPSKQRYAKKHGYDLLALRSFGTDKNKLFDDTELGFLRELKTFEMLEYYDTVMWIDADSIITNDNFSINDFQLDDDHCFYASWDWTGKQTISTGNFIIQKCSSTSIIFDAFLKVGKYVKNTNQWGWEQTTMNLIYRETDLGSHIKVLDHKYLGSIPSKEMFKGIWHGRPEAPYPWSKESFLVHLTGIPNRNRIEVALTTYKDYL